MEVHLNRFRQSYSPVPSTGIGSGEEHTQRPGIVLSITLLANGLGWLFSWSDTGASYYKVVLRGELLAIVSGSPGNTVSYNYDNPGFINYPPPLEIVEYPTQAPSEINQPFLLIQWYAVEDAAYYQVQELVSSSWVTLFEILEIGSTLYSYQTALLEDETTHNYRVIVFNELDQGSSGLLFDITPVVTPPNFIESLYQITYDGVGSNVILDTVI